MKFARRARLPVDANLTPLIDVVFLLLIFFMVSTSFTQQTEITLALPTASSEPQDIVPDLLELVVSRDGNYRLNGFSVPDASVESVKNALYRVSKGDTTLPLAIVADANATISLAWSRLMRRGSLGFLS